jgi:predicted pyridoxine 5'-phosphate oxidase superfamily flavin-nucleotide-binding protein
VGYGFIDIATTPSVSAAQAENGSVEHWAGFEGSRDFDRFTEAERSFIAARDSFYMGTVSQTGWPYVQHRGGPPGFMRVLDDVTLGFADFRGNRQYISLGNLRADDRVSLILVDYPARRRLKLFGHIEARDLADDSDLAGRLATPGYRGLAERALVIRLAHFDWNCPQHIVPRFTETELDTALVPVRHRLAALEAENAVLRAELAVARSDQNLEIQR